jgi:hypothetical protein
MDKFKFIMSNVWAFLKPFVILLLKKEGEVLMRASMEAVTAVAANMQGSKGTEKRDAAFSMIVEKLIAEGVSVATEQINATLEAAVLKIKEAE